MINTLGCVREGGQVVRRRKENSVDRPVAGRSLVTAEATHSRSTRSNVQRVEHALLKFSQLTERLVPGQLLQLHELASKNHQWHLGVGRLMVDDDVLPVNTEPLLHVLGSEAGDGDLQKFSQLPLAQRISQEDEHHLGRDGVKSARTKIG